MTCPRCGLRFGEWLDDGDWSCVCGCITYRTAPQPWVRDVRLPEAAMNAAGEERRRERDREYKARRYAEHREAVKALRVRA